MIFGKTLLLLAVSLYLVLGASTYSPGRIYASEEKQSVLFHSELPMPSEYSLFSGGGWDGNWYVGVNHAWIEALPPVKTDDIEKAFLGALLGISKTYEQIREILNELKGSNKSPGPYEILIGISTNLDIKPEPFLLTHIENIPPEGSSNIPLEHASGSRWFWREIPVEYISEDSVNYVFIWSENAELQNRLISQILAAGVGAEEGENTFLQTEEGITVIRYFEPAVAMKLVYGTQNALSIFHETVSKHPYDPYKIVLEHNVCGNIITEVMA